MPKYKLTYFDARAVGEPIRMLLSYMGQEFEDVRVTWEQWLKIKSNTPFGKLPILEVDGKVLNQSAAITRYLGKEAGLAGANAWEDMQIDIIVDTFSDFRKEVSSFHHEPDPEIKEQKRQKILKEAVPFYFERFDKIVKENNGYLANGKLSWGDIYIAGANCSMVALLKEPLLEHYPNLKAWRHKIFSIPSIKAWIDKRPNCQI